MKAIVVGGGLAGAAAALELVARGVSTTLIRAAPGATALGWGTLDVAGASPLDGGLPVRDARRGELLAPVDRLALLLRARPNHPYTRLLPVGAEMPSLVSTLREQAATLDGWLRPSGLRVLGDVEATRWLADVRGAVRAADLAFTGPAEGEFDVAGEIALVELPGLPGYDAHAAARALVAELAALGLRPRPTRVLSLRLPDALVGPEPSAARLAAHLETDAGLEALRRASAGSGGEGRLLLFPPVLGLARVGGVLEAVREVAGGRVGELLSAPPHATAGFRLDAALRHALDRHGVEVRTQRAKRIEVETSRARAVALEAAGAHERLEADAIVLATGRFVGGGLVDREGRLCEPLLDLPLFDEQGRRVDGQPPRRAVRLDYEEAQPLFSAGVSTDARLRPRGRDLAPLLENLFAAGDLLGGFDPARDRCGLGVALLSGRRAGAEAARALGAEGADG